jgi:hypothetical protein
MKPVDTTIVDLHRAGKHPLAIVSVRGTAWRVVEAAQGPPIFPGETVSLGETLFLDPGAEVEIEGGTLQGGKRGRAHSFVPEDAFRTSPSIADVPKLVSQLEQLEKQVAQQMGEDPLAEQSGPRTSFDRAMAREFAIQNLTEEAAKLFPESVARGESSVCLFLHGEAVCVAMTQMSVRRIRTLMSVLGRPINPHLVDEETIQTLLEAVYGGQTRS